MSRRTGVSLTRALDRAGSLRLHVRPGLEPLVEPGLPLELPYPPAADGVWIRVDRGATGPGQPPEWDPLLRLGTVTAWRAAGDHAILALHGRGSTRGTIDLDRPGAELRVPAAPGDLVALDIYSMLTISAALLLGRHGRALVHAAAVVAPEGGAWLLVGDSRSGKSTTTATLACAGWSFLADDQLLVDWPEADGPPELEGFLRPFHLDEPGAGTPGGRRVSVDPSGLGPGRPVATAQAAGLLFPRVVPDRSTGISPLPGSAALSLLLRQTPWLFALPRDSAGPMLDRLRRLCRLPAWRLRLGTDTFRRGAQLTAVLREAIRPTGSEPGMADRPTVIAAPGTLR